MELNPQCPDLERDHHDLIQEEVEAERPLTLGIEKKLDLRELQIRDSQWLKNKEGWEK